MKILNNDVVPQHDGLRFQRTYNRNENNITVDNDTSDESSAFLQQNMLSRRTSLELQDHDWICYADTDMFIDKHNTNVSIVTDHKS